MLRYLWSIHVVVAVASRNGAVKRKRGFSGIVGADTCTDAKVLGLDDSWNYNWMHSRVRGDICEGIDISAEFVPMISGVGAADGLDKWALHKQWKAANVHYLLGYNEPDRGNGHNHPHMASPAAAAAYWPVIQDLAATFQPPLTLVGPSIASGSESGGSDAWDADGKSSWLDEFFGNCTHIVEACDPSLIRFIAMHDYEGSVAKLRRRVEGAVKHYGGRKVWITEIAITKYGKPPRRAAQNAFLKQVLPYLDGADEVFRYAWFTSRNRPNEQNGGSNLLPWNSASRVPTSTGRIYARKAEDALLLFM
jgi:hypothetical protein